jgi:hypothetical protein
LERDYSNIDVQKSILTKKVYFKDTLHNLSNILIVVLLFSFFAVLFLFDLYKDLNNYTRLSYSYLVLKIMAVLISSVIVYHKLTEKKLFQIKTYLPKEKSRQIIDLYYEKLNYKSWNSRTDIVIYLDDSTFIGNYRYFLIPLDNHLLFTVIKDQERMPLPTILTLWTTKSDLKRLFEKNKGLPSTTHTLIN